MTSKGSWVELLSDIVGTKRFGEAAILSMDGLTYGSTHGFRVKKKEFLLLHRSFLDPASMFEQGLPVNGRKYVGISANPKTLHAKSGPSGVICVRSRNCVLVATYYPPTSAPQALITLEEISTEVNIGMYKTDSIDANLLHSIKSRTRDGDDDD